MDDVTNTRILVVEDDPRIATLIERTLATAGMECDIATTGLDGLWRAREGSYAVMLLDILLPEMNGYEVCRTLRKEDNSIPILMVTAKVGEYDEADGLDLGADDYIRKPFSPTVLISRVQSMIRRSAGTQVVQTLTAGGVIFDPRLRRCTVDGLHVDLTPREMSILETLLRSGEVPMSRLEILDKVWGMDFEGDANVVDVYLGYLRKKIGKERIENIRNIGFRMRP